jgi:geranylgeranyl pyrophosphate synthase
MKALLTAPSPDGAARNKARALLRGRGSIDFAEGRAEALVREAREELRSLPPGPCRDALHGLAAYVLQRRC